MEKEPQEGGIHSFVCSFMENSFIFHPLHLCFYPSSLLPKAFKECEKGSGDTVMETLLLELHSSGRDRRQTSYQITDRIVGSNKGWKETMKLGEGVSLCQEEQGGVFYIGWLRKACLRSWHLSRGLNDMICKI